MVANNGNIPINTPLGMIPVKYRPSKYIHSGIYIGITTTGTNYNIKGAGVDATGSIMNIQTMFSDNCNRGYILINYHI